MQHRDRDLKEDHQRASATGRFREYSHTITTSNRFTALNQRITRMSRCSHKGDLLEQPLDFYEPDVLPATQSIVSKHYRKTQRFGRLLFHRHGISTPCLTNSVKALSIYTHIYTHTTLVVNSKFIHQCQVSLLPDILPFILCKLT